MRSNQVPNKAKYEPVNATELNKVQSSEGADMKQMSLIMECEQRHERSWTQVKINAVQITTQESCGADVHNIKLRCQNAAKDTCENDTCD